MKLILLFLSLLFVTIYTEEEHIDKFFKLKKLYDLGLITEEELNHRKQSLLDDYLGVSTVKPTPRFTAPEYVEYRTVYDRNNGVSAAWNWSMPMVFTPQIDWLMQYI